MIVYCAGCGEPIKPGTLSCVSCGSRVSGTSFKEGVFINEGQIIKWPQVCCCCLNPIHSIETSEFHFPKTKKEQSIFLDEFARVCSNCKSNQLRLLRANRLLKVGMIGAIVILSVGWALFQRHHNPILIRLSLLLFIGAIYFLTNFLWKQIVSKQIFGVGISLPGHVNKCFPIKVAYNSNSQTKFIFYNQAFASKWKKINEIPVSSLPAKTSKTGFTALVAKRPPIVPIVSALFLIGTLASLYQHHSRGALWGVAIGLGLWMGKRWAYYLSIIAIPVYFLIIYHFFPHSYGALFFLLSILIVLLCFPSTQDYFQSNKKIFSLAILISVWLGYSLFAKMSSTLLKTRAAPQIAKTISHKNSSAPIPLISPQPMGIVKNENHKATNIPVPVANQPVRVNKTAKRRAEIIQKAEAVRSACINEIGILCQGKSSFEKTTHCLKEYVDSITSPCQKALEAWDGIRELRIH